MSVTPALIDEHLCLAELGAGQSDRTRLELQAGDVRALVGLGVWPQRHAIAGRERRHLGDVALEHVEIDGDERRVERFIAGDDAILGYR